MPLKKRLQNDLINEDNTDDIISEDDLQRNSMHTCPKCKKNTLEIDAANGRIICTNCGFRETFPGMR